MEAPEGFNPQPIDAFLLPSQGQAITGVILKVTGKAYGDGYSRYTGVYALLDEVFYGKNFTLFVQTS